MLIVWFLSIKSLPNLLFGVLCLPGDQSHPVCATDNKPSCALHLLDWFIESRGFSSLEQRPEFWVLQLFYFLRNCYIVFQIGFTILQSYQQYVRVLTSPHPHHHLLLSLFYYSHPSSHCGSDLHFLDGLMMLNIFSCVCGHLCILKKYLFIHFAHF